MTAAGRCARKVAQYSLGKWQVRDIKKELLAKDQIFADCGLHTTHLNIEDFFFY